MKQMLILGALCITLVGMVAATSIMPTADETYVIVFLEPLEKLSFSTIVIDPGVFNITVEAETHINQTSMFVLRFSDGQKIIGQTEIKHGIMDSGDKISVGPISFEAPEVKIEIVQILSSGDEIKDDEWSSENHAVMS